MYLFAPICGHIRESDFMQNARLENGRRVWQALWEFRHPDIECFTAQVRSGGHARASSLTQSVSQRGPKNSEAVKRAIPRTSERHGCSAVFPSGVK